MDNPKILFLKAASIVICGTALMMAQQQTKVIPQSILLFAVLLVIVFAGYAVWYIWKFHGIDYEIQAYGLDLGWLCEPWPGTSFNQQDAHSLFVQSGGKCVTCGHKVIEGISSTLTEKAKMFFGVYRYGHASHGWPRSLGGKGVLKNSRGYECHVCNIRRGAHVGQQEIQFVIDNGQEILTKTLRSNYE